MGRVVRAVRLRVQFSTGRYRFITLTLRNDGRLSLAAAIKRIRENFSSLRHRKEWKAHVLGGMAAIEAKRGVKHGNWHVHFHVLVEGSFWDVRELSQLWQSVTGDSMIVHIKSIDNQDCLQKKVVYAAKYSVKPLSDETMAVPADLAEAIVAFKGARQFNFLGTWRGIVDEDDQSEKVDDWFPVAPLDRVGRLAEQHVAWACSLLHHLRTGEPLTVPVPYRQPPVPSILPPPSVPPPYLPGIFG